MTIHVVCQRAFARGYVDGDSGDMVFMMCNHGLAQLLGEDRVRELFGRKRLKPHDVLEIDVACLAARKG